MRMLFKLLSAGSALIAAAPALAEQSAFSKEPVSETELAELRGGFSLPGGIQVAVAVQSDTRVDGVLLLRTIFRADNGPPVLNIFGRTDPVGAKGGVPGLSAATSTVGANVGAATGASEGSAAATGTTVSTGDTAKAADATTVSTGDTVATATAAAVATADTAATGAAPSSTSSVAAAASTGAASAGEAAKIATDAATLAVGTVTAGSGGAVSASDTASSSTGNTPPASVISAAAGTTASVSVGAAAAAAIDDQPEGLAKLDVTSGGAAVETAGGIVRLLQGPAGQQVVLSQATLDVRHLVGQAYGTIAANSGNDVTVDTSTIINLDLRNVTPLNIGSAMFRVEALGTQAAALLGGR